MKNRGLDILFSRLSQETTKNSSWQVCLGISYCPEFNIVRQLRFHLQYVKL